MSKEIKAYWEERAQSSRGEATSTTNDIHLRELEHKTLVETLVELVPAGASVLDLGCGDGLTTLRVAADLPDLRFFGFDYASGMVDNARANLEKAARSVRERVRFAQGDVMRLADVVNGERFLVVTSGRCLINLDTSHKQYSAIEQIATCLEPGGYYVPIENFMEGQDAMNTARALLGLGPIPVRWHNLFFREDEFRARTAEWFSSVTFRDFASSYYFATRVIYSGACKELGVEPDYDHPIHRLAPKLPWTGQFSPIRMAILQKKP
jgi:SAM-dependent methyltransferase